MVFHEVFRAGANIQKGIGVNANYTSSFEVGRPEKGMNEAKTFINHAALERVALSHDLIE